MNHVIGKILAPDGFYIPSPKRCSRVEFKQMLLSQIGQKLEGEEGIASGLFVYKLGQRSGMVELATQGIAKQLVHVRKRQRIEDNLMNDHLALSH